MARKKSNLVAVKGTGAGSVPKVHPVFDRPITGNSAAAARIPLGYVLLQADGNDALSLLTEIEGYPRMVGGYGGWEKIQRRGTTSLTNFAGYDPLAYELDLYLDDFDADRSIEKPIKVLRALGGRGPLAKPGQPPLLVVNTGGLMDADSLEYPDVRWVIDALDYDEEQVIVSADADGHAVRVRAPVTVTIMQHVAGDRLQGISKPNKGATRVYTTKSGETLISIARHELGDASRWPEIKALNPKLRDPRKKLKAHTPVKLP
jgi:nucleoid-associated protein YgaU